jgi:predicted nucleic acid-binding protein
VKRVVLDTSAAIAWYLPEAFSTKAKQWQKMMLDGKVVFVAPSLHFWEFANVLRTYVERRELDQQIATEIYSLHLDAPIEIAEPDRATVFETALRYRATAYDSVYIALCLSMDIPFLTAERTTTPWVVKLGKRVEPIVK